VDAAEGEGAGGGCFCNTVAVALEEESCTAGKVFCIMVAPLVAFRTCVCSFAVKSRCTCRGEGILSYI